MAITLHATQVSGIATGATSRVSSFSWPSAGDYLVVGIYTGRNDSALIVTGWSDDTGLGGSYVQAGVANTGSGCLVDIRYKQITVGSTGSGNLTVTTNNGATCEIGVLVLRNMSVADPIGMVLQLINTSTIDAVIKPSFKESFLIYALSNPTNNTFGSYGAGQTSLYAETQGGSPPGRANLGVSYENCTDSAINIQTASLTMASGCIVALEIQPHYPTIALNTTDATDFGSDITPTLEMTGSDAEGLDLDYEISIKPSTTGVMDTNAMANRDSSVSNATGVGYSQSFVGDGDYIESLELSLSKSGTPSGDMFVCIYAHSGTYGTSSVPTGAPLVTSIYKNMSELTTTQTTTKFEFPKPYKTTNGTNYCLVLHCIGQTSGNTVAFGIDSTPSHGGNYALLQDQYSAWVVNTAYDMVFIVNSVTFSLVKLSSDLEYIREVVASQDGETDVGTTNHGATFKGNGGYISQFTVSMSKSTATGTGNIVAKIYATTGTWQYNAIPTGSALATSNEETWSNWSTSQEFRTFTFPTPYLLVKDTVYALSLEYITAPATGSVKVSIYASGTTFNWFFGNDFKNNGADATIRANIYTNKLKFTNTVNPTTDLRPFTQAVKADYTVQDVEYADGYKEDNFATEVQLYSGAIEGVAQSFVGNGKKLKRVDLWLKKNGFPSDTDNITVALYAHSGTFGTSSVPTGSALVSVTKTIGDMGQPLISGRRFIWEFATPYLLTEGTNYCIAILYSGGTASVNLETVIDNSSPTHGGNYSTYNGTSWTAASGTDLLFNLFTVPFIDSTSESYKWSAKAINTLNHESLWALLRTFDIGSSGGVNVPVGLLTATFAVQGSTVSGSANKSVNLLTSAFSLQSVTVSIDKTVTVNLLTASLSIQSTGVVGDANITANLLASAFAVQGATVTADANVSVNLLTASFTIQSVTVTISTDVNVAVNLLTGVFTMQSPSVSADTNVGVNLLTSNFNTQSSSVVGDANKDVNLLTSVFAMQTVTVSISKSVSVNLLTAAFSVQSVSVSTEVNKDVNLLTSAFTLEAVTVSIDKSVSVGLLTSNFTLQAVTVAITQDATVSVNLLTANFTAQGTTVTADANITANLLTLVSSMTAPAVTADANVTVGLLSATFALQSATVSIDKSVSVNLLTASFTIQAPTVSGDANITVNLLTAVFTLEATTVSIDKTVSVNLLTYSSLMLTVGVTTTSNVNVSVNLLTLTFTLLAESVTTGGNVTVMVSTLQATLAMQTPSVVTNVNKSVGLLASNFSLNAVSVTTETNVNISVNLLGIVSGMQSVSVTTTSNVSVSVNLLSATFTIQSAGVTIDNGTAVAVNLLTATVQMQPVTITTDQNVSVNTLLANFSIFPVTVDNGAPPPTGIIVVDYIENPKYFVKYQKNKVYLVT